MAEPNPYVGRYMDLFQGLDRAYGTGAGRWVKEAPKRKDFSLHLAGHGDGLGIAPLRDDGTVVFCAVDLDEPDFEAARDIASLLPGDQVIDKSRSGNAHIVSYFSAPVDGWVARGIMQKALLAGGKKNIEIFPKQDKLTSRHVFGNYLNLPYFGKTRPALFDGDPNKPMTLREFVETAEASKIDPEKWERRASTLGVAHPDKRPQSSEFGTQKNLHCCAEYVLEHRLDNPILEGSRAVVYFALCKQFANCENYDENEALMLLNLINDASPDPIPSGELEHMYSNAVRGRYTSTGCDDPLFHQYADPKCPIANPNQSGGGLDI